MVAGFEGLHHADTLPLGWAERPAPPDAPELAGLNADNVEVLAADASLDEPRSSGEKPRDEDHALAEDLQRVDAKLNVLMQLVARLLQRDVRLPPARPLRLYAGGVEWRAGGDEPADGPGVVTLYVSRRFPQPLALPGRFRGHVDADDGRWARFAFEGLSPPAEELLARLIFRHHRRAIAGTRTHARG